MAKGRRSTTPLAPNPGHHSPPFTNPDIANPAPGSTFHIPKPPEAPWDGEAGNIPGSMHRDQGHGGRRGYYTPDPGRGPYPWRDDGHAPASDRSAGGWVSAPNESHLEAFRLLYGLSDEDENTLQVRFRRGRHQDYEYYGSGHDGRRLEMIYLMMVESAHPGEIVWSHLISEKFPYRPVDGGGGGSGGGNGSPGGGSGGRPPGMSSPADLDSWLDNLFATSDAKLREQGIQIPLSLD